MARYRRRSITVEAERFIIDHKPWPDGLEFDQASGLYYIADASGAKLRIKPGNWIVTNAENGVRYTINNAMFGAMYEPIGE